MTALINKSDTLPPPPRPIRFVHNQGQPPSKRRRINAACLTCRKRKTRCAGERPICSTCTKNGHRCLGYPEEIKKEDGDKPGLGPKSNGDEHPAQDDPEDEDDGKHKDVERKKPSTDGAAPRPTPAAPASRPTELKLETTEPAHSESASQSHQASASASDFPASPTHMRRSESHRVPYFRYFGPTAIVPGFKQMVVAVRNRRRSNAGSQPGTSPISAHSTALGSSSAADSDVVLEDIPVYDPRDPAPVHPLILSLVNTFFIRMGSSYPFLKQSRFMRMVKEKRVEPILVDSICSLAARFSDSPALTGGNDKMPRTERGSTFAQRARQATVDTFPCPTVGAVQACLLMAYEGFGASQDSALWMYLGLAIRMAVDLGLQKEVGVAYQGEKDPLYLRNWSRDEEILQEKEKDSASPNPEEQEEVVQERMDTFWAVFVLDRVISSGTGRPVTFRDDDLELSFPEQSTDLTTHSPAPFPVFLQIIYLYGRVCDVLNKIRDVHDLTRATWERLGEMEHELTRMYKSWDSRLHFNVNNFKSYLSAGQGTTFILLHFWFHALFIILHQPTLLTPFGELRTELQLLPDSRELSISSAKTICDILSFADLIDATSFIGNPFTSQPMYIAACAFLMESSASASEQPSRAPSPNGLKGGSKSRDMKTRHSLLASAANQNYQKCYNSLQLLEQYWGGIKYILTALDQKAKGIWDCETYTSEEYESTKTRPSSSSGDISNPFSKFEQTSPKLAGPPIAWSLAGTANSPNSSLTFMYQNPDAAPVPAAQPSPVLVKHPSTPPGNMVFDPIRSSIPESSAMLAPAYPQANTSAIRHTSRPSLPRRQSDMSTASAPGRTSVHFGTVLEDNDGPGALMGQRYNASGRPTDGYGAYSASPPNHVADAGGPPAHSIAGGGNASNNVYYQNGMPFQMQWPPSMGNMDAITFDSQDIDINSLGMQQPALMSTWLEYMPPDMMGMFDNQHMGQEDHES